MVDQRLAGDTEERQPALARCCFDRAELEPVARPDELLADPDRSLAEVDVAPAQAQDLTTA